MQVALDLVQYIANLNLTRVVEHHGGVVVIHLSEVSLLKEAFRIIDVGYVLYTTPRQIELC